jgi:hypothetical protein
MDICHLATLLIVISTRTLGGKPRWLDMASVLAALEQHDRVCSINIRDIPNLLLKKIAVVRPKTLFLALTDPSLWSKDQEAPVLPNIIGWFFPTSAKSSFEFFIPEFLIPDTYHREAIVACLSVLTRLEVFCLEFRPPQPRTDRDTPPYALSSPLSPGYNSMAMASTWRTSCPELMSLYFAASV